MNFPFSAPQVHYTPMGTPFLCRPGVALIAQSVVSQENMKPFLGGFKSDLEFNDYTWDSKPKSASDHLVKMSGQLCYMSFGPERTMNADISKYLTNIKSSGHGSVLEHPCFSFLCWGISRSLTHELVRHRVGVAYSQVSQRYVSGSALRFVERPEYQADLDLHDMFIERIDRAAKDYNDIASRLMEKQLAGDPLLSGEKKRDLRKKVNQCARSCLPNETEAPIMFSANARALRHIVEMRASGPAEIEIRALTYKLYEIAVQVAPGIFEDYQVEVFPDGTHGVHTPYRKV